MINFAPFYKTMEPGEGYHKKLRKRLYEVDYLHGLKLCYDSFLKTNPNNRFVVQTDEKTDIPYDCHRSAISELGLMESLIVGNLNFVKDHLGKSVLVGADHLVLNPIDNFFDEEFDLGFYCAGQFKEGAATNLSNSVVLVNANKSNHSKIVSFFQKRYDTFKTFPPESKSWWGDQLSLYVTLNETKIVDQFFSSNKTQRLFTFDGLKIKIFEYNRHYLKEVSSGGDVINPDPSDIILDFPGNNSIKKWTQKIYDRRFIKNKGT